MNIGDLVTRKVDNHKILFRIIKIEKDKVYLKGEYVDLQFENNNYTINITLFGIRMDMTLEEIEKALGYAVEVVNLKEKEKE